MDGGTAIVGVLRAFGVSHFFNVPGESFLPVLEALRVEPSIRLVTNRHESGSSFAAEGFAKMSGRPAVCMATRGPGASNLSIGIQTASYDSTPLVALLGLIPRALQGSGAFQEFDPLSMFASLAKRTMVVASRKNLEMTIAQALCEAIAGRPGPVVVGLPTDILSAMAPLAPFGFLGASADVTSGVEPLLEQLRNARHPAFIMSTAAVRGSCAADIGIVASRIGAPVICGWRRFSAFDNSHPSFAGSLGFGGPPAAIAALDRADLVVALGPLDQITIESGHLDRSGSVVVNVVPAPDADLVRRLARARLVHVPSEPQVIARLLAQETGNASSSPRAYETQAGSRHARDADLTADAVSRLDELVPADAVIVSDAGDFAHALVRHFRFDRRRAFLGPLNGAMGYGLPAAIGAYLADPTRPVFCIAGDGGLLMTVGELETATRLGIEMTAIVFNNKAYGTIRSRQAEAFPGHEFGTSLGRVSFAEIAGAMGWQAWSARNLAEFDAAYADSAASSGCRLIEVHL